MAFRTLVTKKANAPLNPRHLPFILERVNLINHSLNKPNQPIYSAFANSPLALMVTSSPNTGALNLLPKLKSERLITPVS